eukprot:TRINITY_DN986_c3_g1_i3.p1 TRINITY_DN986_c3_g1~~TRINITY_DN986_c3_g1_i3.p1  ORF type:complete len:259 (+),score=103.79 TRINITY_DN986_c3_g1_i3:49-825(+)
MVLELVGGGTLEEIVFSSNYTVPKLPYLQARGYFTNLIDGLNYLHGNGVIHKDIKPANLMISIDGILKISDFNVAMLLDDANSSASKLPGSPAFQPPEIASGDAAPIYSSTGDIWASGICLYFMLAGAYPFTDDSLINLFEKIAHCEYNIPEEMDATAKHLITSTMTKIPENRLTINQIKTHEWMTKNFESIGYVPLKISKTNFKEDSSGFIEIPQEVYDYLDSSEISQSETDSLLSQHLNNSQANVKNAKCFICRLM